MFVFVVAVTVVVVVVSIDEVGVRRGHIRCCCIGGVSDFCSRVDVITEVSVTGGADVRDVVVT